MATEPRSSWGLKKSGPPTKFRKIPVIDGVFLLASQLLFGTHGDFKPLLTNKDSSRWHTFRNGGLLQSYGGMSQ
jgi:hypothetical protein